MSDNNNLINLDGMGDVLVKFLDMLEKAGVYAVTPRGSRKDFEDGLQIYKQGIIENDNLSPLEKGARIAVARKIMKEYMNKSKIISFALQDIRTNAKNDVDDDWLNYFFDYAKNISNENVQRIWARILAEETNGDTSIQRQLIHVLSLMDASTANAFTNLCRITIKFPRQTMYESFGSRFESQFIPLVLNFKMRSVDLAYPKQSPEYIRAREYVDCIPTNEQMSVLEEIGLIQFPEDREKSYLYPYNMGLVSHDFSGAGNSYRGTKVKDYIVEYYGNKYKVLPAEGIEHSDLKNVHLPDSISVGFVKYTTIGEKLYKMISIKGLEHFDEYIESFFDRQSFRVEDYLEA